jgi:pimeloyl-ACP methyl ester carboxylesterase
MIGEGKGMTTFGLVHGAWHGAWCWEKLEPALAELGHRAVAMDLPSDDPESSFSVYADTVVSALEDEGEDLVLVGHSLAGLTLPIAATRLPARHVVFLCALIALPGRSFREQLEDEPEILLPGFDAGMSEADAEDRRRWVDFERAWAALYGDCDEGVARWAFDRLRPQARGLYSDPCPLDRLPEVGYTYIGCSEDRLVNPEWSRRAARERLGVEPIGLPGGHSPLLSRPEELARLLDDVAGGAPPPTSGRLS